MLIATAAFVACAAGLLAAESARLARVARLSLAPLVVSTRRQR